MIVQLKADTPSANGLNKASKYKVIALEFHTESSLPNAFRVMVRLLDDDGIPALFEWNWFNLLDHSIESDFVVRKTASGFTEISPFPLNFQGFWESYFNDDESARQLFKDRYPELADKLF